MNNDIREEYHQERIFNVGDMVRTFRWFTMGMIVRRGSNYVSMKLMMVLLRKHGCMIYKKKDLEYLERKVNLQVQINIVIYIQMKIKGTIKGLGFKDVATAKASVAKIKASGRTHAHKIQAAIAMEQRARVMGKKQKQQFIVSISIK